MWKSVEDILNALDGPQDVASLSGILDKSAARLGFQHYAYATLRMPQGLDRPFVITNYPDGWHRHYSDNSYVEIDPVMAGATRGVRPLKWGKGLPNPSYPNKSQRIFDEASEFNVCNGITVPVHVQMTQMATFTIASDLKTREFLRCWDAYRHELHLLALHFHEAVVDNVLTDLVPPEIHLSPREKECLLWTARGKTAWEISEIVCVAESTVVFHLKNAMLKLGVYTKYHAVVKAIMSGLIIP
jgi:LuxR family transcriptional regulator, activator of conjugal transfer of Ti plasmids